MQNLLEEKIEISFDITHTNSHIKCDKKYCVNKGGEICISEEFKEYLKKNYKVNAYLKISEFQKNDLEWLLDNNIRIREFFTAPKGYRLRFKEHDKNGCDFIYKVFQFHQKPVCQQLMYNGKAFINSFGNFPKYQDLAVNLYQQLWEKDILWGSSLKHKVYNYERYFVHLCEETRKRSVSNIYRLFDLSNKYRGNYNLELSDFLALLYTFGHGDRSKQEPGSIAEFVSYFEFFKKFSDDYLKLHVEIAKKESNFNSNNRAILDNYAFLASEEGLKKANEVWDLYYENAKNIFGEGINFDPSINDEEFIRSLRSHLACTPSPFPINFSSLHSATYHAYKHKDIYKVSARELPVCAYLEVIRDVILNGSLQPPRPDQFGNGRVFTFEKKLHMEDKNNVRVYLLKGHQRSTFILSCF